MADDESDEEWRFSVDEFDDPPRGEPSNGPDSPADGNGVDGDHEDDANVAGEFSPAVPVVPETPELENAAVVTLGAALTILALASVVGGPSFGLVDGLVVFATVAALGAVAYGVLVRLTPET